MNTISFDDFKNIELRVAEVLSAEPILDSKKLLKLQVSLGSENRQIVAGIAKHYTPDELVGKRIVVVANLESKPLASVESQGMVLAADGDDNTLMVLVPDRDAPSGAHVH